ncbi:MAG: pas20 [Nonomuraea muscovyensis]|nr:pas20 [Nonomuraea muscovyensis]
MTQAMDLAQLLLGCLSSELQAPHPWPVDPDRVMLRAGEQVIPLISTATDECCTGLAYVRVAGMSAVRDVQDRLASKCFQQERVLTLEMGVYRCVPTPNAGEIITAAQWDEAALKLDADYGAMEKAVCCAFDDPTDQLRIGPIAVGLYEPVGPDANCIGGRMTVNIVMEACC